MKIGICMPFEKYIDFCARRPEDAPDYCEVNCASIAGLPDGEFFALLRKKEESGAVIYSANGLVPSSVRLVGPEADEAVIRAYAEKAFSRLAALGVEVAVLGSSAARRIPDGYAKERALGELASAGRIFSEAAEKYRIRIAIEPLRRQEDNIVNTLADGAALVRRIDRENVRLLADFYHVEENGEPLSDISRFADLLIHCHICSVRRDALLDSDYPFVKERFSALRAAGYRGGISFEGGLPEEERLAGTVRLLRRAAEEAGL